jgi:hypothetical protein
VAKGAWGEFLVHIGLILTREPIVIIIICFSAFGEVGYMLWVQDLTNRYVESGL